MYIFFLYIHICIHMCKSAGRYGTTKFTVAGQSALIELAVSGPFVKNETLIVQPTNGQITWDGAAILKQIPSELLGFIRISHDFSSCDF